MNKFLLRPLKSLGKVADDELDQLRLIPGVHVSCVLTYIVVVNFDGGAAALRSLLARTAWDPDHIGKSRTYRLQADKGPQLDDVLMAFAVEKSLPTRAHLHRYLAAYPQFRQELIEARSPLSKINFTPSSRISTRPTDVTRPSSSGKPVDTGF
ncbi:hypothetical protein [Burkholderia cenocepacia]|uniref:hypothetical protein n=1 Tax=Burkholderia cenocepacia TaxID=95486 RepID=UPI000847C84A|nr:hypothetical protein [Burkholderia cenocepacia]